MFVMFDTDSLLVDSLLTVLSLTVFLFIISIASVTEFE